MKIRNGMKTKVLACIILSAFATGCTSRFGETHYFTSKNRYTGEVQNVFRLKVSGGSDFSNARYLAGFYDERAVDIFFNEVNSDSYDINVGKLPGAPKFSNFKCKDIGETNDACVARYKTSLTVAPLGSGDSAEQKSFVLLLSTQADAISETIGAIASDNVMKQTLFRMANKDTFKQQAQITANTNAVTQSKQAMKTELAALFAAPLKDGNGKKDDYLAVLASLAGGLSPNAPVRFKGFDEAENWFNSYHIGDGS